jgi:hypothetical protein
MRISLLLALLFAFALACNGASDVAAVPGEAAGENAEAAESAETTEAPHAGDEDHEAHAEAAAGTEPAGDGPTSYGDPLTDRDLTPLATIAGDAQTFAGQVVKTEGEIAAVCQRMGCWMEMRAEGVEPIRVPMAGHSFFLPKDVSGRHATIEGEVAVRELSDDEREHLESEGALATAQALQISATGVVIN